MTNHVTIALELNRLTP